MKKGKGAGGLPPVGEKQVSGPLIHDPSTDLADGIQHYRVARCKSIEPNPHTVSDVTARDGVIVNQIVI